MHAIILSGNGSAFCAGYDLTFYAEGNCDGQVTQEMPWDPMKDYSQHRSLHVAVALAQAGDLQGA